MARNTKAQQVEDEVEEPTPLPVTIAATPATPEEISPLTTKHFNSKGKRTSNKEENDARYARYAEDLKPGPVIVKNSTKSTKNKENTKMTTATVEPTKTSRTLPTGRLGAAAVAEILGIDSKVVRRYFRSLEVAKDAETGMYSFTPAQAKKIAAQVAKAIVEAESPGFEYIQRAGGAKE